MTLRRENFTEAAQEAIGASQQLVRRYRHAQWDLEHLFLALLEQDEGVPAQVLGSWAPIPRPSRPRSPPPWSVRHGWSTSHPRSIRRRERPACSRTRRRKPTA